MKGKVMAKKDEGKLSVVDGGAPAQAGFEELRKEILDLKNKVEEDYWELSVKLHQVYRDSLFMAWGFQAWKDYVEKELDFKIRKAQYLVGIQEWFGAMAPKVQEWIRELGWTKARMLISVVTNDNAEEWKKRLKGKTAVEVLEELQRGRGGDGSEDDEGEDGEGGDGEGKVKKQKEKPKKKSFSLFPAQEENVDAALEHAKKAAETDKDGHALDLICTDYLATNVGITSLNDYLSKVEKHVGVQLVAWDRGKSAVVYGGELLDELDGKAADSDK